MKRADQIFVTLHILFLLSYLLAYHQYSYSEPICTSTNCYDPNTRTYIIMSKQKDSPIVYGVSASAFAEEEDIPTELPATDSDDDLPAQPAQDQKEDEEQKQAEPQ